MNVEDSKCASTDTNMILTLQLSLEGLNTHLSPPSPRAMAFHAIPPLHPRTATGESCTTILSLQETTSKIAPLKQIVRKKTIKGHDDDDVSCWARRARGVDGSWTAHNQSAGFKLGVRNCGPGMQIAGEG